MNSGGYDSGFLASISSKSPCATGQASFRLNLDIKNTRRPASGISVWAMGCTVCNFAILLQNKFRHDGFSHKKGEDSLLSFVTFYNNAKWALSITDFI